MGRAGNQVKEGGDGLIVPTIIARESAPGAAGNRRSMAGLFWEYANMNSITGSIEIAFIQAICQAEVNGGRTLAEQERKLFKVGFVAGAMHGIEIAKTIMNPGGQDGMIPKKQKRKLHICPRCEKRFYYWQYAEKHAAEMRHWGNYVTYRESGRKVTDE